MKTITKFLIFIAMLSCSSLSAATWTNWNSGQSIGSFFAIAGTATETVAAGIDGRIATRNNATGAWTIQTITGNPDFRGIVYANGQYVLVREGGSIMTSPNGTTWTNRTSPTTNNLLGILWDGHQYIAGGDSGTILTSTDGITWTNRTSGSTISFGGFAYSGSRYVAAGQNGIRISSDSVTWTAPISAPTSVWFTTCTWTGSQFLACGLGFGSSPTIYTSPDGNMWTLRNSAITNSLRAAITLNGEIYIAGDSVIKKSTDGGSSWTDTYTNPTGSELFMGLSYNGQSLLATGFNHNVWAMLGSSTPPTTIPDLSILQAVALQWPTQTGKTYQVQWSSDLTTWENSGSTIPGDGSLKTTYDIPAQTKQKFYRIQVTSQTGTLQIASATYGSSSLFKDVTAIIQTNVVNNTVNMSINNQTMQGDPAFGSVKQLKVSYTYNGANLSKTVNEGSTLVLP